VTTEQLPRISKSYWNYQEHRICYTVQGSGIPLILIHGFGASIGHWQQNVPVLALGGDRVFVIDLLGFGGSDKPAIDYSAEVWEALLADFCAELV